MTEKQKQKLEDKLDFVYKISGIDGHTGERYECKYWGVRETLYILGYSVFRDEQGNHTISR